MSSVTSHSKKKVCIIGGGFAGLAAAVFLDAHDFQVTLLERKPILGGRAYSFQDKKTDTWVDNGQHLLIGAYHETLKFLENIGATHTLSFQKKTSVPLVSEKGIESCFEATSLPSPLNFLFGLLKMKIFSLKEKWNFLKLGQELRRLKKGFPKISLDQTVEEWLTSLNQSLSTRTNFWDPLTLATLNDDPKVAGASMLAAVLTKGFMGSKNDSRLIFPRSPLNDLLSNPARAYLEMRGHTLLTSTSVKKIHILDGQVQSIELDAGEIQKADLYISAVPFSSLLRMIPEGFVDSTDYFGNLKKLKCSPIISINFWFDYDVLPKKFVGVAGTQVHWYFNKNKIYNETHPPYHIMGVISGAYALVEKSREEILKIALEEFYRLFPEAQKAKLIHSLVNKEREATLSPTAESESLRPSQKSPFSNFYVIGDWTKTGLPATIESAVLSARLAVDQIEKKS